MKNVIAINSTNPLVGEWKAADAHSEVMVSINFDAVGLVVSVFDNADGEVAEVYEPTFDGIELSFSAHWTSNGRFIKYRFLLVSEDSVDVSFQYSGQETWLRQKTE